VTMLETVACLDGLHTFCDGTYEGWLRGSATQTGDCGCLCHRAEHVTDAADPFACWCEPYRDDKEPRVIVHRKVGRS
jgi:hypothetical protein